MTARDKIHAAVLEHLGECSDDELRAVGILLARLELGRKKYRALDIATDPRDWNQEADEEAADLAIYLAFARLAARRSRP